MPPLSIVGQAPIVATIASSMVSKFVTSKVQISQCSHYVSNFNTLDYLRFITIFGASVNIGYLSGIKPGIRGPSMVTGGLIGVMGGFMYAYQNSASRILGFFPNEDDVARYKK